MATMTWHSSCLACCACWPPCARPTPTFCQVGARRHAHAARICGQALLSAVCASPAWGTLSTASDSWRRNAVAGWPPFFVFSADAYWSRYSRAAQLEAQRLGQPYKGLHSSTPPKHDQPRCLPCTLNATSAHLGCSCVGVGSLASIDLSRYFAQVPCSIDKP